MCTNISMYTHMHISNSSCRGMVMYRKKVSPQGPAGGIKLRNQQLSENKHVYETSNRIQMSSTSNMAVKTTNLEREKHADWPI